MTGREYRRVVALPNLVAPLKALFPDSDSSISLPLGTPHVPVTLESGFNVPSVSRRLPDLQTLIPSPVPGSRCGCATRRLSINTPARGAPGNGAATARLTTDSLSLYSRGADSQFDCLCFSTRVAGFCRRSTTADQRKN